MQVKVINTERHFYDEQDAVPIAKGMYHKVSALPLTVRIGARKKVVNVFVREPKGDYSDIENSPKLAATRAILLSHGIPVIPMFRVEEETGKIFMTDLTEKGLYLVHSPNSALEASVDKQIDFQILNISIDTFIQKLHVFLEKVILAHCQIVHEDAVFFKIGLQDHMVDFLIGDYKWIRHAPDVDEEQRWLFSAHSLFSGAQKICRICGNIEISNRLGAIAQDFCERANSRKFLLHRNREKRVL